MGSFGALLSTVFALLDKFDVVGVTVVVAVRGDV
jgi:hypothetical protein